MKPKKHKNMDEGFRKISPTIEDFQHIDWKAGLQSLGISSQGHQGVVFIQTKNGAVVFKATDGVPIDLFLSRLAQTLQIAVPEIRVLSYDCQEFKDMMKAIEKFCYNDELLYEVVMRRLNRPYYELMEYVRGVTIPSIGPERFKKIFVDEEYLMQLGKIIGLDMIVNNSDRLPLYWDIDGNTENIIFALEPVDPKLTWQEISRERDRLQGLAFAGLYAIDTHQTIMDPQNKLSKTNFDNTMKNIKGFLTGLFAYISDALNPAVEDTERQQAVVKEFNKLNEHFGLFCSSVIFHDQIMVVSKGIITCLNDFLKKVGLEGVVEIKNQLKKEGGQWEDSYWNSAIAKIYDSYFAELIKILNALWIVHQTSINGILQYEYEQPEESVKENFLSNQDINIKGAGQGQDSEHGGQSERSKQPEDPSNPSAQNLNKSMAGSIKSKANSIKSKNTNKSKKSKGSEQQPKDKEPQSQSLLVSDPQIPDTKSITSKPPAQQPSPEEPHLNLSKLDQKLAKFSKLNKN